MSSRTLKGLTALTLSTSLLAFSAPAMAQLDEIIVTAQKREQSLQDVPISISAVSYTHLTLPTIYSV